MYFLDIEVLFICVSGKLFRFLQFLPILFVLMTVLICSLYITVTPVVLPIDAMRYNLGLIVIEFKVIPKEIFSQNDTHHFAADQARYSNKQTKPSQHCLAKIITIKFQNIY